MEVPDEEAEAEFTKLEETTPEDADKEEDEDEAVVEEVEEKEDEEKEPPKPKTKTIIEDKWLQLNSQAPIWTRSGHSNIHTMGMAQARPQRPEDRHR